MTSLDMTITPVQGSTQGEELYKLKFQDGSEKVFNGWDYAFIYSVPDLYRKLYCEMLEYKGFQELGKLLLKHATLEFNALKVLDVACGSGLMGNFLKKYSPLFIEALFGVDLCPEAIQALKRDYPNVYDEALVVDDMHLPTLKKGAFNCLSICGGASQVELVEFQKYVNILDAEAFVVFNLRVEDESRDKILDWLNRKLTLCESKLYNHRRLADGTMIRHEAFLYKNF